MLFAIRTDLICCFRLLERNLCNLHFAFVATCHFQIMDLMKMMCFVGIC
jgi:hypothetical protein